MTDIKRCPRCNSQRLIPDVRIIDRDHGGGAQDLSVEIYERPDALLFKGRHRGVLRATICGDCGHAATGTGSTCHTNVLVGGSWLAVDAVSGTSAIDEKAFHTLVQSFVPTVAAIESREDRR